MRIDAQFFGLDRTGGVLVLMRYLTALRSAGHEVSITTLGRSGDRRFVEPPSDIHVRYAGLRGRPYRAVVRTTGLGYPSLELRQLRRSSPSETDLRLATYSFSVLSALDDGAPVHHHVQHYEVLMEPTPRRRSMIDAALRADVYRTANCTWVADQLDQVGSDVRGIIPPAIDHEVFNTTGRVEPAGEDADAPFRVMTLGKAMDWKGMVDVVSAVATLHRDDTRPTELVSYGPDKPATPPHMNAVHHGFVDSGRLAHLYRSSDVSVTASWYESFPLPPIEAMACGTPVICTRLGTEDYAVHEHNCLIVPARDPDAIASALRRLRDDRDLRRTLVANGLTTAERFHWADAERSFVEHAEAAARN